MSKQSFSFIRSSFTLPRFEGSEVLWLKPSGHSKSKNGPHLWNGLLESLRPAETVNAFKSRRTTHPFNSAFKWFSFQASKESPFNFIYGVYIFLEIWRTHKKELLYLMNICIHFTCITLIIFNCCFYLLLILLLPWMFILSCLVYAF